MMPKRLLYFFLVVCWLSQTAPLSYAFTTDDAIASALSKHPLIKVVRYQEELEASKNRETLRAFFPVITAFSSYSNTNNPVNAFMIKLNQRLFNLSTVNLNFPQSQNNLLGQISVSQLFYDGFSTRLKSDVQQKKFLLANQKSMGAILQLIRDVKISYFQLYMAKERLNILQEHLKLSEENYRTIQNKYEEGITPKTDLYNAEVIVKSTEAECEEASGNLEIAREIFLQTSKMPTVSPDDLETKPQEMKLGTPLEDIQALFNRQNIDIKNLALAKDIANEEIKLTKTNDRLKIRANADYNINTFFDNDRFARSYSVYLTAEKNIFDGGIQKEKINQAVLNAKIISEEAQLAYENKLLNLKQAYYNILISLKQVQTAESTVKKALEGYKVQQERYNNDLSSTLDLFNSQVLLKDSELLLLNSLVRANIHTVELDYLLSKPLEEITNDISLTIDNIMDQHNDK